ncbi:catecholate siderophore receptor CirA [Synergistales bacterium]|nr:catecholate siderophore receptor CirA [Synergistales bacterium]
MKRISLLALCVLLLIFLLLSFTAASAAPVDLEAEVVTASGFEEDKDRSPGSVTVLRAEEFRGETQSLPDMLERVPGLHVTRSRGRGAYTVASVRGSTSAQVAVYVDGSLQNLGSEAAVDLSAIPVSEVDRIEVYRGVIPARFAEAGLGGVINIITRAPAAQKTTVSVGIGSLGQAKGGISHSRPLKIGGREGKFLLSAAHERSDGDFSYRNDNGTPYNETDDYEAWRRDNGRDMSDVLLKWNDGRYDARVSWSRDKRGLPVPAPGMEKGERRKGAALDTEKWDMSLAGRYSLKNFDWGWRVEGMTQDKLYDNPDNTLGGIGERHNEYRAKRISGVLDASWAWGERHFFESSLTWSKETLDVKGDIVTLYGGESRYEQTSLKAVLQDSISLTSDGKWLLTPSVRWSDYDGGDGAATWAAALTYQPNSALTFKGGFGTYSREPNLYEKRGDGATIRPSQNLSRERGTQWDLGVLWNNSPSDDFSITAGLTYFGRKTDDMIEFLMTSPRFGIYENIAKAEVHGIELESRILWKLWDLSLSGTWMDARNKTGDNFREDKRLPNAPEWAWTARLARRFLDRNGDAKITAFLEGQFTGDNYFDKSETILYDDIFLLNAGVKWNVKKDLDVTIGVYDALDNGPDVKLRAVQNGPDRASWYPLQGRSFYMTVNWSF